MTSGTSVLETANALNSVKLQVTDAVVLIDRQQGGGQNLALRNIQLHACYSMFDLLKILFDNQKINTSTVQRVTAFLQDHKNVKPVMIPLVMNSEQKRLTFDERSELCTNAIAKQLFSIMVQKKSNLCCSADLLTTAKILNLVENVGPYICLLKTHIDIIVDYNEQFVEQLKSLAVKYNFMIFEDRKFADIGNTVKRQFGEGIYHISSWAHVINAHTIPGPGIIQGLKEVSVDGSVDGSVKHGLLLLAEMSSKGNLATDSYTDATVKLAEENSDFVIGFICMRKLSSNPCFIHMTPGVHLQAKGDNIGQQYLTPQKVIQEKGSDLIIVGRGIYKAENSAQSAQKYRDAAWNAYQAAVCCT